MKRTIILFAVFLMTGQLIQAQIFAEGSGNYLFYKNDPGSTFNALGAEVNLGYFFTEDIAIKLGGERFWHPNPSDPHFKYWDIKTSLSYTLVNHNTFEVYLAAGVGHFWKNYDLDINIEPPEDDDELVEPEDDNFIGWFPAAGVRLPLISQKFLLDVSAGYYFFPDKSVSEDGWYNLKAGLQYRFGDH